jgi:hypothetical protein
LSIDEASKILIPKKYMEGHAEALMQLFDAPDRMERELRGDGKLVIYNPALSLSVRQPPPCSPATSPMRNGKAA